MTKREKLIQAQQIAIELFNEIERRHLIQVGKDELCLNEEIYQLALHQFNIEKHWHKRIVRAGKNTLAPYKENPPNLIIKDDDILFFDFGPVIEEWEADLGRTYVVGANPLKRKIRSDIEKAWIEIQQWFENQSKVKASDLYKLAQKKAIEYGWEWGGQIAGHLIGSFPHEKLDPGNYGLYIHPENDLDLYLKDQYGEKRDWILELHFIDKELEFGAFYEQLL